MNEHNLEAINKVWSNPADRTKHFFGYSPYFQQSNGQIMPYQLGIYLKLWGELYGQRDDPRVIVTTGRGIGKTMLQELFAADAACFMPYFLQAYYGEKKPIDVTIIFVSNVKRGSMQRLDNVKKMITSQPYLERHLVDYDSGWTKEQVNLKNNVILRAESASDRVRGFHSKHIHGKVIYLIDEFAFLGGSTCLDGQTFVEEVAEQSFGAMIGCFTTPYGKRGGAWWAWNHPNWTKYNFPTWINPRTDKKKLALKVKRLLAQGRQVVVDQEIRGLFVDDVGLFFTMDVWQKSINTNLEWLNEDPDNYSKIVIELHDMIRRGVKIKGNFLLGLDPNGGGKSKDADPFGVCLVERIGNKYFNRFCTAINGKSHDEMMKVILPLCAIYRPYKINMDGGGGYHSGPEVMMKGQTGVSRINIEKESRVNIVGYMSKLRSLMAMGRFEQPPSDTLRDSQMSCSLIADTEDSPSNFNMKFQTQGKQNGIPCDLAAMGLSVSREHVITEEVTKIYPATQSLQKKDEREKYEAIRYIQSLQANQIEGYKIFGSDMSRRLY